MRGSVGGVIGVRRWVRERLTEAIRIGNVGGGIDRGVGVCGGMDRGVGLAADHFQA